MGLKKKHNTVTQSIQNMPGNKFVPLPYDK